MIRRIKFALRRLLHAKKRRELLALAAEQPLLAEVLAEQEKYEIDLLIRPYGHLRAPFSQRLERLAADLRFFTPLLGLRAEAQGFCAELRALPKVISEGVFALILSHEGRELYALSLTLMPQNAPDTAAIAPVTAAPVTDADNPAAAPDTAALEPVTDSAPVAADSPRDFLLIACAQGLASTAELKAATKAASGLRPLNLALAVAQSIAQQASKQLAGVRDSAQISGFKRRKNDFISYDELWRANAQLIGVCEHFYALAIARRSEAATPSKKRAEYRRRHALIDEISQQFRRFYEAR